MLPTLSIRSSNDVVVRFAVFSAESFWYHACALEKTDRIDDTEQAALEPYRRVRDEIRAFAEALPMLITTAPQRAD